MDFTMHDSKKQFPTINVNKEDDQFFIALAQKGNHSYVMCGVRQISEKKNQNLFSLPPVQLLATIGKVSTHSKLATLMLITDTPQLAYLRSEPIIKSIAEYSHKVNSIFYKAYDISLLQYKRFVNLINELESTINPNITKKKNKYIKLYRETKNDQSGSEDNEICFDYTHNKKKLSNNKLSNVSTKIEKIKDRAKFLSLFKKSCRTTAIDIVNYTRNSYELGSRVSKNPLRKMPFKSILLNGKIDQQSFYCFPYPVESYNSILINEKPERIKKLLTLYKLLENFTHYNSDSLIILREFNAIKELYYDVANKKKETIDLIWRKWKKKYRKLLSRCHRPHFFERCTPLQHMFMEIKNTLLGENVSDTDVENIKPSITKNALVKSWYENQLTTCDEWMTTCNPFDDNNFMGILNLLKNRLEEIIKITPDSFYTMKKFIIINKLFENVLRMFVYPKRGMSDSEEKYESEKTDHQQEINQFITQNMYSDNDIGQTEIEETKELPSITVALLRKENKPFIQDENNDEQGNHSNIINKTTHSLKGLNNVNKLIKDCEENNKGIIDYHRGFHFFSSLTKTRKMFNQLNHKICDTLFGR